MNSENKINLDMSQFRTEWLTVSYKGLNIDENNSNLNNANFIVE